MQMVAWLRSGANPSIQLPHVQESQMTRGNIRLGSSESGGLGDDHLSLYAHEDSPRVQTVHGPNADQIDPTASPQLITRARSPFVALTPINGQGNLASC
jgi:hypothetical protein